MKRFHLLLFGSALLLSSAAFAQTDHDNLDEGRPLTFDDAEPMATGGLALEFGADASLRRRGGTLFGIPFQYVNGIAPDTQLDLGFRTGFGGGRSGRFEDFDVSILRSFRREIRNSPALALKFSVAVPVDGGDGATYRIRGILTKAAKQYDRFHLNLDLEFAPGAVGDERRARAGVVLGYSSPIGYPLQFNTTMVAELGLYHGVTTRDGANIIAGIGFRSQITPRSMIDAGIQSSLTTGRGSSSIPIRLVAGYSVAF